FFFAIRDMKKGGAFGKSFCDFNAWMRNRQRLLIPPFGGSNPPAPASQCGLHYAFSGCVRPADIPAGWLARPSLWSANSGISGLDWWLYGASLRSEERRVGK